MSYFIRPRQDLSLATVAWAMRCLEYCDSFHPVLYMYKEGSFPPVILISIEAVEGSKDLCEKAITTLIDLWHFTPNNFDIVEVSLGGVIRVVR